MMDYQDLIPDYIDAAYQLLEEMTESSFQRRPAGTRERLEAETDIDVLGEAVQIWARGWETKDQDLFAYAIALVGIVVKRGPDRAFFDQGISDEPLLAPAWAPTFNIRGGFSMPMWLVALHKLGGYCYMLGYQDEAHGWWSLAARHGSYTAILQMAHDALEDGDHEYAQAWASSLVEHADALIGERDITQEEVETDPSVFWGALLWAQAAALGHAPAQQRLDRLRDRLGADPDFTADPSRVFAYCDGRFQRDVRAAVYEAGQTGPAWRWLVEPPDAWEERCEATREAHIIRRKEESYARTTNRLRISFDPAAAPIVPDDFLRKLANFPAECATADLHVEQIDPHTLLVTIDEIEDPDARIARIRKVEAALNLFEDGNYLHLPRVLHYTGGTRGDAT
jgi:hypothetical protein